ncbi:MAG: hypothetical protein IGS50_08920 [Synechococcales cyanobacterium C42_A2020_086]|jgi:hypothetical protein|nr:hypothetical protein [Synechococcales cyanobacterium M58_A2018_015]MBF2073871.1 hypothetical protein [Synechococcales cyanobacterium C42_A2020_086]
MKANTSYLNHYSVSAPESTQPVKGREQSAFAEILSRIAERLASAFLSSSELRIQQIRSRTGEVQWEVYDPMTEQVHVFASEAEVRCWIEQRYYQ